MHAKQAADDCANAAAAALGVTVTQFGKGEKMKKKQHIDNQDYGTEAEETRDKQ